MKVQELAVTTDEMRKENDAKRFFHICAQPKFGFQRRKMMSNE